MTSATVWLWYSEIPFTDKPSFLSTAPGGPASARKSWRSKFRGSGTLPGEPFQDLHLLRQPPHPCAGHPLSLRRQCEVGQQGFHSRRQARLFYSIFDSQSYRDTAKTYLKSPEHWLPDSHPYYSEPREGTELFHCSADLYGLETMFRTSLVQHPCRNHETYVYI